ncbi:MAG: sulfatase [Planctomycetota bacterium]
MPERPQNVLFVFVDDLNLALGCYGHPLVQTPNIDRLAARGVRFSRAFCTYPLCGPSRSALLTGRRPEWLRMPNNEVSWRDRRPDVKTLPQLAREAGLHTRRLGKVQHHGLPGGVGDYASQGFGRPHTFDDPPSWDHEWGKAARVHESKATGDERLLDGPAHGGTALHTCRVEDSAELPDTLIADRAVAFLASSEARDRPFFLGVGFHKPHVPLHAPRPWWRHYDNADVSTLITPTARTPCPNLPTGMLKRDSFHRGLEPADREHLYRGYLACVSYMDEQVGRVVDALDASGLRDSTLVVFVADHGYHTGEQGHWDKMMLMEPSLRVPMIVAGAGVEARGAACDAVCETIDVFPTVAGLMGWEGEEAQGRDLQPWLRQTDRPSDRPAFAWLHAGRRQGWSIRDNRHRYTLMSWEGGAPQPCLFDLEVDPHETHNLANDPDHASLQTALDAQIREHFRVDAPVLEGAAG